MIKHFLTGIFTTLIISSIVSVGAIASEINDTVKIDNSGKVTLVSENIADNNVNTLRLTLEADTDEIQDVSFSFVTENSIKISEYRYNSETRQLNIYLSGIDSIFKASAGRLPRLRILLSSATHSSVGPLVSLTASAYIR